MKTFQGAFLAFLCAVLYYRLFVSNKLKSSNLSNFYTTIDKSKSFYSSIWCDFCSEKSKCCEIHNLVFYPQERTFIFVLSESSIMYGISNADALNKLAVSSVLNHTELFLPVAVMKQNDSRLQEIRFLVARPVFLLHRFKPDNIMHALHDDLLPLFARYESHCRGDVHLCVQQNLLAFVDPLASVNRTDLSEAWYQLLSQDPILDLYEQDRPFLLSKVLIGLPDATVGYQYGFGIPQGPIPLAPSSGGIFKRFVALAKREFGAPEEDSTNNKTILLISRKQTRKILNEPQVLEYIKNAHQILNINYKSLNFLTLDLQSTQNIGEIISIISNSDIIVAMHGASTYLAALFSKDNATMIELFPYGIQPTVVSPIQSIAKLPDCWFRYSTWQNSDVTATRVPDEAAPTLLGGLGRLSEEERRRAEETLPVPAVQCCHDSTYLYRMFQDTIVGPSFQDTMVAAIQTSQDNIWTSWTQEFVIPGQTLDLKCYFIEDAGVTRISWKAPINLSTLQNSGKSINYDVTANSISGSQIDRRESMTMVEVKEILISVWVRACLDFNCGKDSFVNCK